MNFVVVEHRGVRRRLPMVKTSSGVWIGWPGGAACFRSECAPAVDASAGAVVAPMTGKVIELRAEVGQTVAVDETLVVLEAMKMEYRLTAPRASTVTSIDCQVGQLVELGATLVMLGDV